ncbi:MAG: agmatine deiminase family protein [Asticcacaulis sp.]
MTRLVPAEWAPHAALWIGFPSHADLWQEDLDPAQDEVAALIRALAAGGTLVKVLVMGEDALAAAQVRLADVAGVEFVAGRFGDIWLRDTGPIYVRADDGGLVAVGFTPNGWGGKYDLPYDDEVAAQIATNGAHRLDAQSTILEGGALEHDGLGTILTTRQCLLNPNRNPGWTEAEAEAVLARTLGAKKVIWLDDGLVNDHTDGHIDNLARFVAPGVVACPVAWGLDDPNTEIYDATARALAAATDARGEPLKVVRIPSPGRMENEDGDVIPASHMNFIISNGVVAVPTYGTASADLAVEAVRALFPQHTVIGLPSGAILTGGGSFHCITQQVPAVSA